MKTMADCRGKVRFAEVKLYTHENELTFGKSEGRQQKKSPCVSDPWFVYGNRQYAQLAIAGPTAVAY
jgi:hypothetical protein